MTLDSGYVMGFSNSTGSANTIESYLAQYDADAAKLMQNARAAKVEAERQCARIDKYYEQSTRGRSKYKAKRAPTTLHDLAIENPKLRETLLALSRLSDPK